MKLITCPICEEPCGKEHPDTWSDPGYREGKGENFTDINGVWYCSQECLTTYEDSVEALNKETR